MLLGKSMPWLSSAAFTIAVPCGASLDPPERIGLSHLTGEMVLRGAGQRTNREFVTELENLGVEWTDSIASTHTFFSGASTADRLGDALSIFADVLRRPRFDGHEFAPAQETILQEILATEDEPADKAMRELRKQFFPQPWGRSSIGEPDAVQSATLADVVAHYQRWYRPNGMMIGVAGNFDWETVCEKVDELWGDWQPGDPPEIVEEPAPGGICHLSHDSQQTHIGLAYPTVPYNHPDYYLVRGALGALSGGTSARLFTEVRERRGLCYSVGASYHSLRHLAAVFCYSGTTSDRAQQTLEVLLAELTRLREGITEQELQRLKARVKSSLVMQQESSSSQSGLLVYDYYHLGRIRSMAEVASLVDALTCPAINEFLERNPPRDFTIVTVGPEPLEVPGGIS